MYFETVDDNKVCPGIFYEDNLSYGNSQITQEMSRTWKYASRLKDCRHIEYAQLYALGSTLEQVCPDEIMEPWQGASQKMSAFVKSLGTSKIDLASCCLSELLPESFLLEYLKLKSLITKSVFENFQKPENYEHLYNSSRIIEEIRAQEVNVDYDLMRSDSYSSKVREFSKKMKGLKGNVYYNLFGTRTGRLTVKKRHFPILTLDKDLRKYVKPNNDLFVEIDINGAEIRTLLALLGQEQPQADIHDWNAQNVYGGTLTREEAKKRFFAWLYNPVSDDYLSSKTYDRDLIRKKFWNGRSITTPFQRTVKADEYHCINYVLQSTSNDICLEQAVKVFDLIQDKKSKISFLMHDSIVLDVASEERGMLNDLIRVFRQTRFGKYLVNVRVGKNFSEMRSINWKP